MNCPSCRGYKLQARELEGGMISAHCPKCQGDLLSLLNYQFWLDAQTMQGDKSGLHTIEAGNFEDSIAAKQCPKCNRLMSKYKFSNHSHNRLDYCAPCGETWIDRGEWQLLKQLGLATQLAEIFSDKWQRQLREAKLIEAQSNRFKELVGDTAFLKAEEFKQWLKQQDKAREILHYIQL